MSSTSATVCIGYQACGIGLSCYHCSASSLQSGQPKTLSLLEILFVESHTSSALAMNLTTWLLIVPVMDTSQSSTASGKTAGPMTFVRPLVCF